MREPRTFIVKELLYTFRWQDGVDIFLLAIGIYSLIQLIRGTRAVPILIGLSMVYGLYFLSGVFEIYTVNVLLNYLLSWSLVLFLIVFQNDIRRLLTQVGTGPLFSPRDRMAPRSRRSCAGTEPRSSRSSTRRSR